MNEDGVYIDVVIVDANPNPSRMYFEDGWSDDASSPPTCFSDNGIAPSTQAASPQSPTCAGCKMAEWGSAVSKVTGQGIPACTASKKLAVIVVDDPSEQIYEFVVPPGSWSDKTHGWKRYTQSIAGVQLGNRSADLSDVVTRIFFVQGKMGVMGFKHVAVITPELAERVDDAWASGETARICGMEDKPRDAALPVAPKPQALAAPVQSAQPVAPPPPQPKKRAGRPAKAAQEAKAEPTDIPPFLPQRNELATTTPSTPVPQSTAAGIQAPLPFDADLNATLSKIFNLPT